MSEWIAVPVDYQAEIESNCWHELWQFNGGVAPKYWYGQRVLFHGMKGRILGLEWRDADIALPDGGQTRLGWWYRIQWDNRYSLQGVHEDSLVLDKVEGD